MVPSRIKPVKGQFYEGIMAKLLGKIIWEHQNGCVMLYPECVTKKKNLISPPKHMLKMMGEKIFSNVCTAVKFCLSKPVAISVL